MTVLPRSRRSVLLHETVLALVLAGAVLLVLQAMQAATPPTPVVSMRDHPVPRAAIGSVVQIMADFAAVNTQAAAGTITEQQYRAACQRLTGRLATVRKQLRAVATHGASSRRRVALGAVNAMRMLLSSGSGPKIATADTAALS